MSYQDIDPEDEDFEYFFDRDEDDELLEDC